MTLFLATSCVPMKPVRIAAAQRIAPVDAPTLLHRLALAVPEDLRHRSAASTAFVPDTPIAAPSFSTGAQDLADASRASDCLTAAVYYEARSESIDGQRAVAQVVLNRVRDRAFPNSVCGVVYQGSTRRTGCQFSFTCDGSLDRPRDPMAWRRARAVATAALAGLVFAPVGAATYYHAFTVLPWWASSLSRIGSIGAHIFYRWRGGMERALAFRQTYAGREPTIGDASEAGASDVAIHYGDGSTSAVTVHRGVAATLAVLRIVPVAGVRVHFGGRMNDPASSPEGEATVSEETGPI